MSIRKEYIEKAKAKLDEFDAELTRLEVKAEKTEGEFKEQIEREIRGMKQSRQKVEAQLNEVRSSSEAAWEDVKVGVELAWDSLAESLESATQRFK